MPAPLIFNPITWGATMTVLRQVAITTAIYFAADSMAQVSDDVKETITPTTDLPDGRDENTNTFTWPLAMTIALVVFATGYTFDKFAKVIFAAKKKR